MDKCCDSRKASEDLEILHQVFDRLFPICRSITGVGLRQSLDILGEHMPIVRHSVPTGENVFDWTIPEEWLIRSATLVGPDGKTYADFGKSNLSVINYSAPVNAVMPLDILQKHLHSLPDLPTAIPYVTSYYQRNWGFCLSHESREAMPQGDYHAAIDSEFVDGVLDYGDSILPGETKDEVLVSSYLCHPSLANNELSGPLVLMLLHGRIAKWPRRRLTYRFVLAPETIGSIAYLSRHGDELRERAVAGLVLTCLGGPSGRLRYKTSRRENALVDRVVATLAEMEQIDIQPFSPIGGSDERQYCSPGFNLPIGQVCRNVYGEYDGYHNSLDTKEFMGIEALVRSVDSIERILRNLEIAGRFENLSPFGEPQLGRRGLYPNVNSAKNWLLSSDTHMDGRQFLNCMLMILNYSDGSTDMLDIAKRCNVDLEMLIPVIEKLESQKLLRYRAGVVG